MKRNTLVFIMIAAILGGFVYYFEIRNHGEPKDETTPETKPAFTFKDDEIAEISLTRADQTITIASKDGKWVITKPVDALADQPAASSLADGIAHARVERTITASADEVKAFGLDKPEVALEVKLKDGSTHRLRLGSKDFSGSSVYAQLDDSKDVALVASTLLTNSDKSLNDLRDRSVLDVNQADVTSLDLNNENGQIQLAKDNANWTIKSPIQASADDGAVTSLLTEISAARAAEFSSESADNLAKFGLDKPKVTVTAHLQGGAERKLVVGSKTGERYYAKNSDHAQIFQIEAALYQKLNTKVADLRDKQIIKVNQDDITKVSIKNANQTLEAGKNSEGKWTIAQPPEQKDRELQTWRVFDPLQSNKATELIDKPSSTITAKLAKPDIELQLTDKDGKTTSIKVSSADGDSVYVRVEGNPLVYKAPKKLLEDLSFKAADVVL
jgi:hypothetical protein